MEMQILFLFILSLFYIIYIGKMLVLRKRGIQGSLLGKGNKPKTAAAMERMLKGITFLGAAIQFASVLFPNAIWQFPAPLPVQTAGAVMGMAGIVWFLFSVITMWNNWRAGFDDNQNTELVTSGIYKISRNPAFVGFDLLYIGCAVAFPNVINCITALAAVIAFHIQILNEEKFLVKTFGKEYHKYKSGVRRYV